MKIVSKAQQRFLGARLSGNATGPGPSPAKARIMLDENRGKMSDLPARAPVRKAVRVSRRGSR